MSETNKKKLLHLLSYSSVGRQAEHPDGGFQLFVSVGQVAAATSGNWSNLNVELFGLLVVKIGITGVEVVLLLIRAA